MNEELRIVLMGPPLKTNAATALVVGTALNAINQGDAIVAGDAVDWAKFALNFVVPLCVASWGSYGALLAQRRARASGQS